MIAEAEKTDITPVSNKVVDQKDLSYSDERRRKIQE
jgi:hypothetical protein